MDDDLDALLAELEQAQAAAPKPRLSERNVVDLIRTLHARGYLTLLSTADGRGYVTRERLAADVAAAVTEAGGRIALVDLPSVLNVDLAHVQAAVESVVGGGEAAPPSSSLSLVGGDVIAPAYWQNLAAEVAALLADGGASPSLGELAGRFGLGVDALVAGLHPFLNTPTVPAKIEGGRLVAPAAVARARAALRGALRGAAAPLSLSSLTIDSPVPLTRLVDELVGGRAVSGKLRPGGLWVPAAHADAAAAGLAAFYADNGYVEYARVWGGGDRRAAVAHLEATFPGGVALSAVYAGPAVLAAVDAAAEAGAASAWCDVHAALPPVLTRSDTATLMSKSASVARIVKRGGGCVCAGTCVVGAGLVADLTAKAVEVARAAAAEAPVQAGMPRPRPPPGSDDDEGGGGRKGGRKGGKRAVGRAAPTPTTTPPSLSLRALTACVAAWVPGSGKAGGGDEDGDEDGDATTLAAALAARVRPAAVAEYERAVADAASAGAGERRRAREAAVAAAGAATDRLQLYARGAEVVLKAAASDEKGALTQTLHRHLARGPGAEAVDGWLAALALDAGRAPPPSAAPLALTPAQRAAMATGSGAVPADALPAVRAAVGLLAASSAPPPSTLVDALEALATAAGGRLRRLDKKGERALLTAVKAGLVEAVAAATDAATTLPPAAALAFARAHGRAVSVPGRALGALVASLDGVVSDEEVKLLRELHTLTVASLRGEGGGDDGRLEELVAAVKQRVLGEGAGVEEG